MVTPARAVASQTPAVQQLSGILSSEFLSKLDSFAPGVLSFKNFLAGSEQQVRWPFDSAKYAQLALVNVNSAMPLASPSAGEALDRKDIPVEWTWNFSDIYPTQTDWEKAIVDSQKNIKAISDMKETATSSAKNLYETLAAIDSVAKEIARIYTYAHLLNDLDTRVSSAKAMFERADLLRNDLITAASFLEPAIIELPKGRLEEFQASEPSLLNIYGHALENVARTREHTLSAIEENIYANLSSLGDAAQKIYELYKDAVMARSTVTLSDGQAVKLTDSNYTKYRSGANREDRTLVFQNFWAAFARDQKVFAETLNQTVLANVKRAKVRKYNSAIEAALFSENIAPKVYDSMIEGVHNGLPTLWRYLGLRKKLLKLDRLEYQDMYASIIPGVDLEYIIPEGEKMVLNSLKPLGEEYVATVKHGFENRWADLMPNEGKASGAYMDGACVDVHPFVLLNFEGDYNSVSTIAHEFGHAMHSWFTSKTQPYVYTDYSTFTAEVASTANELLLARYATDHTTDKQAKLALLGEQLESIRTAVFRQALFAEFEKIIYDKVWAGEPLTDEVLDKEYGALLKRYYGHEEGVTYIDDRYNVEWAYIPHFYYNFYVYNYTTSLTASISLAKNILSGDKDATKAYIEMLKKGGSEYPVELLKEAGVDMTTTKPYEAMVEEMNRIMDEIETLIAN